MNTHARIQHVNLLVDNIAHADQFYGEILGLPRVPNPEQGFRSRFFQLADGQQFHVNEIPDDRPYRAHVCIVVDDFNDVFRRAKTAGVIDIEVWGKIRRLPSGTAQMFLRDPSGNLVEISAAPNAQIDDAILNDDLWNPIPGVYTVPPGTVPPPRIKPTA